MGIAPSGGVPPALVPGDALVRAAALVLLVVGLFLAIAVQFLEVRALYGSGDADARDPRTNCPSCGARTPAAAGTCEYCGEAIER